MITVKKYHGSSICLFKKKPFTGTLISLALFLLAFNQCAGTKNPISLSEAQGIVLHYLDEQKSEDTLCCNRETIKSEKTGNRYLFTMKGCKCPCSIIVERDGKNGYRVRKVTCY
jgi:hypothetical protein